MKLGMSILAGQVLWHGAALRSRQQSLGTGLTPRMLFPLLAVVTQRTPQRPGRRESLCREFQRELVEGVEMIGARRARAVISVTRRAARASRPRTGAASPSASCQCRYSARPVCLTTHTPAAITISVDGTGTMPADANDSGSHDRSALDSGRKPPSPSSKTSTASWPSHLDAAAPVLDLAVAGCRSA